MAPKLFGTSSTNMNNLNQGALNVILHQIYSKHLYWQLALTPSRKPMDPALLSLYISLN